ncbi:c-type cytochrome biogenesis protein CcsB [Streptomyces katsurahamanus]|uniref:C-type cytochrome biogenesis protein CcsB n=1 Tax=Streptomyces katsurahamanus TaxID=2577098 RepID=A0ABW9NY56_9ACTN|nr:c-type cytochrome biogenesis protein CcsB [Streptomyces katsurahamanus]MQS38267.1 c-type cytochrome biogenesis protein CcsB [Streptomyces katsurahamanus]
MTLAAATNENLAEISNILIYSAMAVYTLAFLAHIAEWVLGSRSKVGRTAAALTGTAPAAAVTVQVRGKQGGGTAVLEKPKVVTRSAPGTRDVPDGPGAAGGTVQGDLYGRIAISLTVLAFAVHAGGVFTRALSVQRAPWGNMYEFSITFSSVLVGAYLVLLAAKKKVRWLGLPLVGTVLADLGVATTWLYTASDQLVPALDSYWLWIHVSTAIFCGAVFYLGAVGTLLYLFRDSYESKLARGDQPGAFATSVLDRLPSAASLDKFAYRVNAAIFPLWTFTIIAGAIWAGDAWGRYWGWDPKEVWSFITWAAYACYLHARATAGWKGRKAAVLALIAFACWLFNYYGVNIFVDGLHSYA